jgi:hypothetical protein
MFFWLTLEGDDINYSSIEKLLNVRFDGHRVIAPVIDRTDMEYSVFYPEIYWLLDLIENKCEELLKHGICFEDSQIWMIYRYDAQCNMEFDSGLLQRMGNLGLKLCISCYDASDC